MKAEPLNDIHPIYLPPPAKGKMQMSEVYRRIIIIIIIISSSNNNIINVSNNSRDICYISGRDFPPLPAALLEYNEAMHYVLYI